LIKSNWFARSKEGNERKKKIKKKKKGKMFEIRIIIIITIITIIIIRENYLKHSIKLFGNLKIKKKYFITFKIHKKKNHQNWH
jgi:hypothetical protein